MIKSLLLFASVAILAAFCCWGGESSPIYEGLDTYRMKTSLKSEAAQKYFDQGLLLYYGYNYPEAARSFEEAANLDPNNGVAYWGVSLSYCDCIETPDDRWHEKAHEAYKKAVRASKSATPKERDLINALAVRFLQDDVQKSGEAFVESMAKVHEKYPDDPDISAIYCNVGVKNIDLFHGIRDQNPKGSADKVIEVLEESMKEYPNHPGLNHFYIHAMESAGTPEKALKAAELLDGAVPGSGHLQHMPAHIYYLYGRYHEATEANLNGIEAEDRMFALGGIKDPEFAGFYMHNYYFLFQSLIMEGRLQEAVDTSHKLALKLRNGDLPTNAYLEDVFFSVPYLLMARSEMWDQIAKEPVPMGDLVFANGARAYALGLASLAQGNKDASQKFLGDLKKLTAEYASAEGTGKPYNPSLHKLLQIGSLDLEGQIDAATGNPDAQIEKLKTAVSIEDTIDFHMLPWYFYMRHSLGAALIKENRFGEAEIVFREDLVPHPHNLWALSGLIKSLQGQNRHEEAKDYQSQLSRAMKYADPAVSSLDR